MIKGKINDTNEKLNFWSKTTKFFRTELFAILASIVFLFTWWEEKVTIENSRSNISNFFRIQNEISEAQVNHKLLELQTLSITNEWGLRVIASKTVPDVTVDTNYYHKLYYKAVNDQIHQQFIIIHGMENQLDIGGDFAAEYNKEKSDKESKLNEVIATNNYELIYKFSGVATQSFRKEYDDIEKHIPEIVNELFKNLDTHFNYYLIGYLIAGFLLTIGKINNTK